MASNKDIDDLYLEALGYYASLSVMSVLAAYIIKNLTGANILTIILLSALLLVLLAFFAAIHEALSNLN